MKKRAELDNLYKWNLVDLFSSTEEARLALNKITKQVSKIDGYKGKLRDIDVLTDFLKFDDKLSSELNRVYVYFYLVYCEDLSSSQAQKDIASVQNLLNKLSIASSWVTDELVKTGDDYLLRIIGDPNLKDYSFKFRDILRSKEHILDENSEKLLAHISQFSGTPEEVFDQFDNVDLKFDKALDSVGKLHEVNNSTFSFLLESKDRVLRQNAFNSLYKGFKSFANTIGTNYIGHVKADVAYSKIYKYNSTLESELFDDNVEMEVYNRLVKNVNDNVGLLHKYFKLRKKLLGVDKLTYADFYVSLAKQKKVVGYNQMLNYLTEGLSPLGSDYINVFKTSLVERWADVYPNANKKSGAFQIDVKEVHPYILLNTMPNIESVFTYAHEFGHAMHSYYANLTQPNSMAGYPIMLAEIASTTNEVLMLKYFYKNASTKQEKIAYLDKYLQMFKSTIYRQTMFSEFEDYAHKTIENDGVLSVQDLCDYYANLNKHYHGKAPLFSKDISYEWLRIPHFYSSYYVFKYATGLVSAINIATNILDKKPLAIENYKTFLCSGGSDYPLNILNKAQVDLSTDTPYNIAFGEMKWALNELEKLV